MLSNINDINFCMNLVRKLDIELFLCLLRFPKREEVFSLAAFDAEVSSAAYPDNTRLKFWQDVVHICYSENKHVQAHPVARALFNTVRNNKLSKFWLLRLVSSRMRHSALSSGFMTMNAAEQYADESVSSLLYLFLELLGTASAATDHAASHLGKAQGLIRILKSVPLYATCNRCFLPMDVLVKHGVTQNDVIQQRQSADLSEAIYDICCYIRAHEQKCQELVNEFHSDIRPIYLPLVCVRNFLKRIDKLNYDIFDSRLYRRAVLLPIQLWFKK